MELLVDEELSDLLEDSSDGTKHEAVKALARLIAKRFDEFKEELRQEAAKEE